MARGRRMDYGGSKGSEEGSTTWSFSLLLPLQRSNKHVTLAGKIERKNLIL